jgi:hypothetical protein
MLPSRSRFRNSQYRAMGDMLPDDRNLTIFCTSYLPRLGLAVYRAYAGLAGNCGKNALEPIVGTSR